MTKFESGYKKFEQFIDLYSLITKDDKEIVIAYSGGKDASLMCDFLYEYKKKNQLSLELKLLVARFPKFLFDTKDPMRTQQIKDAFSYWRQKGFDIKKLDYDTEHENVFLEEDNPCNICAKIKTELMGKYIRRDAKKNKVYALGMNFDDCLSWLLEVILLSSKYKNISELKEKEANLYRDILTLTIRITHKLYDKKSDTRFIRPIIAFTNKEIKEITTERNIPLIQEDCKEISKKATFRDSPRREFSEAIGAMRERYNLDYIDELATYNCYDRIVEFITESNLVPSVEELNHYMSNSLMV